MSESERQKRGCAKKRERERESRRAKECSSSQAERNGHGWRRVERPTSQPTLNMIDDDSHF